MTIDKCLHLLFLCSFYLICRFSFQQIRSFCIFLRQNTTDFELFYGLRCCDATALSNLSVHGTIYRKWCISLACVYYAMYFNLVFIFSVWYFILFSLIYFIIYQCDKKELRDTHTQNEKKLRKNASKSTEFRFKKWLKFIKACHTHK